MSERDREVYWKIKNDPEKYEAYLARKIREQKARRQTPKGREYERARKARWRASNPTATRLIRDAGHAVEKAVRNGSLYKRRSCQKCHVIGKVEAHHHKGYAKEHWLDVEWLCSRCHQGKHAKGRRREA